MDNLSHTLPKKSYRDNNGFSAGKTIYDDVFGGPPKFGVSTLPPRLDDYTEIFQAFHASRPSSIPFLDLPVTDDDSDLYFDVRASNFDYSEVFGGFNGLDFAVSYEELFHRSNVGDDSSEDAWTPAQCESLSDESVPSTSSEVNQSSSNADPDQSLEPLKLSHNNAGSETIKYSSGSDGMSHEDQFNVVPESTFSVDEIHPSQKIENEMLPSQLNRDHYPSMDYDGSAGGKQLGKSISQPPSTEFGIERYATGLNPVEGSGKTGSSCNRPLLSVSDINLKTRPSQLPPPSRPPPGLASRKGDPPTLNSKVKASKSYAFEQMAGESSPPYYDVEIDASSSAAASAAAMKDAMEKAQAQLRSAKELMERKRSGLQSCTKLWMEKDIEDKEIRLRESCDRSSIFEDGRIQGACEEENSGPGLHAWEERHKLQNTIQVVTGSIEGQKNKNEAGNSVESKSTMGQMSSKGSQSEGTHASIGATQLSNMVGRKQVKDSKILEQSTTSMDFVLEMEDIESFERQNVDRYTEAREHHGWQENKTQLESAADQNNQNMETEVIPSTSHMDVKHLEKRKVYTASEVKEKEKILRISQQLGEIEKTVIRVDENEKLDNLIDIQLPKNEVESGVKLVASNDKLDTKKTLKSANVRKDYKLASAGTSDCEIFGTGLNADVGQEKCGIELKKTLGQGAREKQHIETQEKRRDEKKEDKSLNEVESERKVEKPPLWDENEKAFEMPLKDENEMCRDRAKMVFSQEEQIGEETLLHGRRVHEKKVEEVLAQEENLKKQTIVGEKKQYAETLNCACEKEENVETYDQVCNPEGYKRTSQEVQEREESEEREKVVFEKEGVKKKLETLEEESENRVQDAYSLELLRRKNKDLQQPVREEEHKSVNLIKENRVEVEENFKTSYMAYEVGNDEINVASRVSEHDANTGNREITSEALDGEGDGNIKTDQKDCEKLIESVEWAYDAVEETVCLAGKDHNNWQHERANMRVKVLQSHHVPGIAEESNEGEDTWKSNEGDNGGKLNGRDIAGKLYECESVIQQIPAENGKRASELGNTVNLEGSNDKVSFPQVVGECAAVGSNILPSMFIKRNAHNPAPKVTSWSIGRRDEKPSEILREEREREEKLQQERVLENDRLRKIEEREREEKLQQERVLENDRLRKIEEREREEKLQQERVLENDRLRKIEEREREEKLQQERVLENDRLRKIEEREREEKLQQERTLENDRLRKIEEEREREEKLQQERALENDRLRKIEEEREREREREKDRMAMDRATLEARERAFAEARERAERASVERATAEVRQRALAEARERLEKACAEARERSHAEKTSIESRFRAERPAVEKAAAEARERAVEKTMAGKAAFEARERTERSVADKFSASSRSTGIKLSSTSYDLPDSQFQNAGSYSGSRYSHISSNNVGEGDSPQRCKARLERHQRTAERAAKALAEKNMRDLVAQKEQAERSRLAEGLDAEVKRWSSGKEGNLRALLSTLQYILGPDSGWQPVPLTEVITTVAVKKAYRKATLCVHPDKLQQRGASIQQKYICEKVFDLLKEAWNKFSSEEW